jgi:transcription-repair coupling factor (superfamily II helicase)
MSCYSKLLKNSTEYNELLKAINASLLPSGVTGLPPSPKAHLIHSLCEDTSRRALVILPNEGIASRLVSDINEFAGNGKKAYLYPARDYSFNSSEGQSREFEQARIKTLCKIINEDYSVIACSAEAALQLTITPDELKKRTKTIDSSTTITPEELITTLVSAGFKRADTVEGAGQFAHRGGIIDFFPVNSEKPVRIEIWGDCVDNISEFDPSTQRRTDILDFAEITPATEILFDSDEILKEKIEELYAKVSGKGSVKVKQNLLKDIDSLSSGVRIAAVDKYLNLAYQKPASIFDLCKGD